MCQDLRNGLIISKKAVMADRLLSLYTASYVRPDMRQIMCAGLRGTLAVGMMSLLAHVSGSALLMVRLGATAVLGLRMPHF